MSTWPQWTYIALTALGLTLFLVKDGQPREPYNFYQGAFGTGIVVWLLWMGGFFAPLG